MKILLINDHYNFGGGGDAVLNIEKRYLEKQGHDVYLYTWGNSSFTSGNDTVVKEPEGIGVKWMKFVTSRSLAKHFERYLASIKPDVIHIHLVSKYLMAIYPYIKDYKVVQTLHGPNLFCATGWGCLNRNSAPCSLGIGLKCYTRGCCSLLTSILYTQLMKRINGFLKNGNIVYHCPSRNVYNMAFQNGYENLVYIPLGLDSYFHECTTNITTNSNIILYVGGITKQKGVLELYESFKILVKTHPDYKLLMAGVGALTTVLKENIIKDGLKENVSLLGRVNHDEIIGLYSKCTVAVVPSIWNEQFGLVGPEALAMGKPVVGSNIGGIPEWLHHNEWGYLVTPRDVNELTNRLNYLIANPEQAKAMGERGRRFVLEEYSYHKYVSRMDLLLKDVYNENKLDYNF